MWTAMAMLRAEQAIRLPGSSHQPNPEALKHPAGAPMTAQLVRDMLIHMMEI